MLIDYSNIWNARRIAFNENIIKEEDKKLINDLVDRLSKYSSTYMLDIIHKQYSWMKAYRSYPNIITIKSLKDFFMGDKKMINFKETDLYQEIEIFDGDTKVGEAEVNLKNNMLSRLYIYEGFQDKGYGTEVVEKLIKEYKCDKLWVETKNKRASHVYTKIGFEIKEPTMYLMELKK